MPKFFINESALFKNFIWGNSYHGISHSIQKKIIKKAPKTAKKVSLPKVKLKTNMVWQIIFMIATIIFLAFMILKFHEII